MCCAWNWRIGKIHQSNPRKYLVATYWASMKSRRAGPRRSQCGTLWKPVSTEQRCHGQAMVPAVKEQLCQGQSLVLAQRSKRSIDGQPTCIVYSIWTLHALVQFSSFVPETRNLHSLIETSRML